MSYTRRYFEPKDHACERFLGQQVLLPELYDQFHPRLFKSLENPLDSLEAAWEFVDCMKWGFLSGMDDKLAPEHWGVAWARGCEAMFWRLQDLLSDDPKWGLKWADSLSFHRDDEPEENIQLNCESLSVHYEGGGSYNLERDLSVYSQVGQTRVRVLENHAGAGAVTTYKRLASVQGRVRPNPLPERLESDLDKGYGEKLAYEFWKPMDVALVLNSLRAWDATRFGANKFHVLPLSKFQGNPVEALRHTFGDECAAGLRAYALSQGMPPAKPSGPKSRF